MISTLRRLRYKAARSRLNIPLLWLRHRGLDSTDVFVASYPRSGQHWVRFQLFEILMNQSADFDSLDSTIPQVGEHGKALSILPSGGRLISDPSTVAKSTSEQSTSFGMSGTLYSPTTPGTNRWG